MLNGLIATATSVNPLFRPPHPSPKDAYLALAQSHSKATHPFLFCAFFWDNLDAYEHDNAQVNFFSTNDQHY